MIHPIGLQKIQIFRNCVANAGVHHALFPQNAGDPPGIHAADAGNVPFFQQIPQISLAAEIGGRIAQVAHHIAPGGAFSLKILGNHTIIANEREGLQDDLSGVAGIRQGLQITAHAGGKHRFPQGLFCAAEAPALKYFAVFQHQICLFHCFSPYSVAAMTALMVCMRFSA